MDFIPTAVVTFISELGPMLAVSGSAGPEAADFMESWATYYWAWWVSWTPFVGMFIARISKGRTLREFVTVVIIVPAIVCLLWFSTMGGTAIWMETQGMDISGAGSSQEYLFRLLGNLPFAGIVSVIAMLSVVIFFITSADSASLVMSTIASGGKPTPPKPMTIAWGAALAATGIILLVAGGSDTVAALQALVTISALPFALILILLMVAWWRDLSTDPLELRTKFADAAIDEGVRRGIQMHGDSFAFSSGQTAPERGAGSWLDSEDASLTQWYEDATAANETHEDVDLSDNQETGDVTQRDS